MNAAIYKDRAGNWKWMIVSGKGGPDGLIAVSGRKFARKDTAVRSLKRMVASLKAKGLGEITVV